MPFDSFISSAIAVLKCRVDLRRGWHAADAILMRHGRLRWRFGGHNESSQPAYSKACVTLWMALCVAMRSRASSAASVPGEVPRWQSDRSRARVQRRCIQRATPWICFESHSSTASGGALNSTNSRVTSIPNWARMSAGKTPLCLDCSWWGEPHKRSR